MKGITCCGDCAYYSFKKHKCTRCNNIETDARSHFYDDCPLPNVVEKENKYRWHDLRKNPEDLPQPDKRIVFRTITVDGEGEDDYWTGSYRICGEYKEFINDDAEGYETRGIYELERVIAWRYIEPFEGEE